jgi:excisionase family DNA binding protein
MSDEELFLTLVEAARYLRCSRSRLYERAVAAEIPSVQLNGRGQILFRREDLDAALKPVTPKSRKTAAPRHANA